MNEIKMIAMIPARLGSKRIPKKNIRYLRGKPLLQYAIDLTAEVKLFDEVYVNSESDLIGELATINSVDFHKRPNWLSDDTATNQHFTREFLEKHKCDYVIMVNATSPLLRANTLNKFCQFVIDNDFDTVFSVIDEKAECFYENTAVNFPTSHKINSQDLVPVQKVVWALTAWRRESFLQAERNGQCGIFHGKIGLFPIPKDESCDLDTMEDWAIAEGMLEARNIKEITPRYWGNK